MTATTNKHALCIIYNTGDDDDDLQCNLGNCGDDHDTVADDNDDYQKNNNHNNRGRLKVNLLKVFVGKFFFNCECALVEYFIIIIV